MRQKTIDIARCTGCKNCELACIVAHSPNQNLQQAYREGGAEALRSRCKVGLTADRNLFPQHCRHCEDPQCVQACMSGALAKNADGYVVCDSETCIGCFMCVMSCPFGFARPSTSGKRLMLKCDGCRDKDCMACVAACPTGCLSVSETDRQGDVVQYLHLPDSGENCS
ncbi:MAG: 4Fe-4S dicluster domain-containing protein [Syntrophotaleaceae bacterium]